MRIVVTVIGCLWAAVVLALVASRLFSPERGGPLALAMVVEPLLLVSLVVFIPLAVFGTSRSADRPTSVWTNTLRALLLVAAAVAAVRLGPAWLGPIENGTPANASGNEAALGVTSWNIEADDIDRTALVDRVRNAPSGRRRARSSSRRRTRRRSRPTGRSTRSSRRSCSTRTTARAGSGC